MDNEYQQGQKNEGSRDSGIIPPRQVIHHPIPTSSGPAQITRPSFSRRRGASGGRVGGALKSGAKSLGKKAAKEGGKKIAVAVLSNPYVLAAIGIGIAILLLIIIIAVNICELTSSIDFVRPDWLRALCVENDTAEEIPPPPKGVTITKIGPDAVGNESTIPYSIKITYDPIEAEIPLRDMILIDTPDYDHAIVSAENPSEITGSAPNENVTWKLSDFMQDNSGVQTHTFTLSVQPNVINEYVINYAYIQVATGSGATQIGSGDDGLGPGEFKIPFRCNLTYTSISYDGHSPYSVDINRGSGSTDRGDPVFASADGTITAFDRSNGQMVIRHEGNYYTLYAHMQNVIVRVGDIVKAGQKIGEIGSTYAGGGTISPHLHVNHGKGGSPVVYSNRIQVCYVGYGCNPASVANNTRSRIGTTYNNGCP